MKKFFVWMLSFCIIAFSGAILSACKSASPVGISATYVSADNNVNYNEQTKTIMITYGDLIDLSAESFEVYVDFDDGTKKPITLNTEENEGFSLLYELDYEQDTGFILAGTYQIIISYGEFEDVVFNFVVADQIVARPTLAQNSFTYTGLAININAYISKLGCNINHDLSDNLVQTNAGTYKVVFDLNNNNLMWEDGSKTSYELIWEITQVEVNAPTCQQSSFEYSHEFDEDKFVGIAQTLEIDYSNTNEALFELDSDSDNITQTNAGSYVSRIKLKDTHNYKLKNNTNGFVDFAWSITPKTIQEPTIENKTFVYDYDNIGDCGEDQTIQIVYLENEECLFEEDLTKDSLTQSESGLYNSAIKLKDTQNYVLASGETSLPINWEIEKLIIETTPALTQTEFTFKDRWWDERLLEYFGYTDQEPGLYGEPISVSLKDIDNSRYFKPISGTSVNTKGERNVGDFVAVFELRNENIKIKGTDQRRFELPFVIHPKVLEKPYQNEIPEVEYTGAGVGLPGKLGAEFIYFEPVTPAINVKDTPYEAVLKLQERYKGAYVYQDGTMEDVSIFFKIIKRKVFLDGFEWTVISPLEDKTIAPIYVNSKKQWLMRFKYVDEDELFGYSVSYLNAYGTYNYPDDGVERTEEEKRTAYITSGFEAGKYIAEFHAKYDKDNVELVVHDGDEIKPFDKFIYKYEVKPITVDLRDCLWYYGGEPYRQYEKRVKPDIDFSKLVTDAVSIESIRTSFSHHVSHSSGLGIGDYTSTLYIYYNPRTHSSASEKIDIYGNPNFNIIDTNCPRQFSWKISDKQGIYLNNYFKWHNDIKETLIYGQTPDWRSDYTSTIETVYPFIKFKLSANIVTEGRKYGDVGDYRCDVVYEIDESKLPEGKTIDSYEIFNNIEPFYVKIEKAHLDMSKIKLKEDSKTYDETPFVVEVDEKTIPNVLEFVSIKNNTATEPGTYYAEIEFKLLDTHNYYDIEPIKLFYGVDKIPIRMDSVRWPSNNLSVVYSGENYMPQLIDIPDNLEVVYHYFNRAGEEVDEVVDVGYYIVKAELIYDTEHYRLTSFQHPNGQFEYSHVFYIKKIQIDMSAVEWQESLFLTYTGETLKPVLLNLPDGVTARYTYGVQPSSDVPPRAYIDTGTYWVRGKLIYDEEHYELVNLKIVDGGSNLYRITPKRIYLSTLEWDSKAGQTFAYDGENHNPQLVNLPEYVEATYTYIDQDGNEYENIVDVGVYTVTVTLTTDRNHKVIEDNVTNYETTVEITQVELDLNNVCWNIENNSSTTYDGTEHKAVLLNVPSQISVNYTYTKYGETVDTFINASTYNAVAEFVYNPKNFILKNVPEQDKLEISWKIIRQDIDMTGVVWSSTSFTYDGTEHRPILLNLPEGLVASYTYEKAMDPFYEDTDHCISFGNYCANASFNIDSVNYQLVNFSCGFYKYYTILPLDLEALGASWDYDEDNPFVFDGTYHSVNPINLPEGAIARFDERGESSSLGYLTVYSNQYRKAGNYTTVAYIEKDGHDMGTMTINWTIKKAKLDVSHITLDENEFTFNGEERAVKISYPYFEGYDCDRVEDGQFSATDAGTYIAKYIIYADRVYDNYDRDSYEDTICELEWIINKQRINLDAYEWQTRAGITLYEHNENYAISDGNKIDLPIIAHRINKLPKYVTINYVYKNSKGEEVTEIYKPDTYTATYIKTGYKNYELFGSKIYDTISFVVRKMEIGLGYLHFYLIRTDQDEFSGQSYERVILNPYYPNSDDEEWIASPTPNLELDISCTYDMLQYDVEVLEGVTTTSSYGEQRFKLKISVPETEYYSKQEIIVDFKFQLVYSPVKSHNKMGYYLAGQYTKEGYSWYDNIFFKDLLTVKTLEAGSINFENLFMASYERIIHSVYFNGKLLDASNQVIKLKKGETLEIVIKDNNQNVIKNHTITIV